MWVFVTEILPRVLPAEKLSNTEVWGIQLQGEIWSGTIRVTGDLLIPHGAAITILPGTKVIISSDSDRSNFDFLPWHLKAGLNEGKDSFGVRNGEYFWDETHKIHIYFSKLIAIGTSAQPIVITSDSTPSDASPYDVNSITVGQGVLSHVQMSNYRKLEIGDQVTVRDSQFSKSVECSICIGNSDPTVINNHFTSSVREDIWIGGGSPRVTDNYFSSDSSVGIEVDPESFGAADISHNDFEMPMKTTLEVLTGDEEKGGSVTENIFSGDSLIRIPCDSQMKIEQNDIEGRIVLPVGECAQTLNLGKNYWGTTDLNQIREVKILNKDRFLILHIDGALSGMPKGVGPRPQ